MRRCVSNSRCNDESEREMNEKLVKLLEEAEKTIGLLMLEVNRLNDEIELLKERKNETISELQG